MTERSHRQVTLFIFTIVFCASQQTVNIIPVRGTDNHTLSATTTASLEYELRTPKDGKLLVTVEELRMNVEMGDYMMVKRGPRLEDEGTGMVYSGMIDKPTPSILIASDSVLIKAHVANDNFKRKFQLKYRLISRHPLNMTSTTSRPSTRSPWPSPAPGERTQLVIYVSGYPDYAYHNVTLLMDLKVALRNMANAYCKASLIDLREPVRLRNVLISELKRCPYVWPASSDCVAVTFALPVLLAGEDVSERYQLLAMHLKVMWERHHALLLPYGLRKYEMPDVGTQLTWWNSILGALLIVLAVCACIILAAKECYPHLLRPQAELDDHSSNMPRTHAQIRNSLVSSVSQYEKFMEK